jgi:hypothetical protein
MLAIAIFFVWCRVVLMRGMILYDKGMWCRVVLMRGMILYDKGMYPGGKRI